MLLFLLALALLQIMKAQQEMKEGAAAQAQKIADVASEA